MKKILIGLFVLVGGIGFSGCLKSKDPGCPYTDVTRKAPDSQVVKVRYYLDSVAHITDYSLDSASGVFYKVENPGTTTTPAVCSVITFYYKGMLTNGTVFDQSQAGSPSTLWLGDLIVGWQKGLKHIKGGGGKIKLYIPPYLGYGDVEIKDQATNTVRIPAKSILIFDVTLESVQ
ncbi:MAG: FKBP-type peptidyl-prolyl cis-trans isomerase [Agriterribacter sp.]